MRSPHVFVTFVFNVCMRVFVVLLCFCSYPVCFYILTALARQDADTQQDLWGTNLENKNVGVVFDRLPLQKERANAGMFCFVSLSSGSFVIFGVETPLRFAEPSGQGIRHSGSGRGGPNCGRAFMRSLTKFDEGRSLVSTFTRINLLQIHQSSGEEPPHSPKFGWRCLGYVVVLWRVSYWHVKVQQTTEVTSKFWEGQVTPSFVLSKVFKVYSSLSYLSDLLSQWVFLCQFLCLFLSYQERCSK